MCITCKSLNLAASQINRTIDARSAIFWYVCQKNQSFMSPHHDNLDVLENAKDKRVKGTTVEAWG